MKHMPSLTLIYCAHEPFHVFVASTLILYILWALCVLYYRDILCMYQNNLGIITNILIIVTRFCLFVIFPPFFEVRVIAFFSFYLLKMKEGLSWLEYS